MSNSSYPATAVSNVEQQVLDLKQLPTLFRTHLVGVMRASRVSKYFELPHQQLIWDTGTNVIGPVFFFFVWWVLDQARQRNIKRIYFLARDGQLFMDIAKQITQAYGMDIDCRYLHGSRQSWLVPSIKRITPEDLPWIFSDWWYELSVEAVCRRIGFNAIEIQDLLGAHGFMPNVVNGPLTRDQVKQLQALLLSDQFHAWYEARFKQDTESLLGYFRQEGLLDDDAYALVDIGWRGNQQFTLNNIFLRYFGKRKSLTGFYFGLTEAVSCHSGDQLHGFLFDLSRSLANIHLRNNHLTEVFAATKELKTIRFACEEGRFKPFEATAIDQRISQWGVDIQQAAVLSFCALFIKRCPKEYFISSNYMPAVTGIFSQFLNNPTLRQAEVYGSFPLDGEMTESNANAIAPTTDRVRFWRMCFNLKRFKFFWVQATFLRSGLIMEFYIWKILLPILSVGYYWVKRVEKLFKVG